MMVTAEYDEITVENHTSDHDNIISLKCCHIILILFYSACTSASLEPSYVLRAIGSDEDLAHSSIRLLFYVTLCCANYCLT